MSPLDPASVLLAYRHGVFPMAAPDGTIGWYDADPRAILPLDEAFHVPRSLRSVLRAGRFEIRVDTAFADVIRRCAARKTTWISREIIECYVELHRLGHAHSVEAWSDGALAGGVYGVAVGGFFASESMFTRRPNAGKAAIVALDGRLRRGGFVLHDVQTMSPVARTFGAMQVSQEEYVRRLRAALQVRAVF